MSFFAQIDEENIVQQTQECDRAYAESQGGRWVEYDPNGISPKNCAGRGMRWDEARHAFLEPQPYPSWVIDEAVCHWVAPEAMPEDGKMYVWNEDALSWDKLN